MVSHHCVCVECGKSFTVEARRLHTALCCSMSCRRQYEAKTHVSRTCATCGMTFTALTKTLLTASRHGMRAGVYCSVACRSEALRIRFTNRVERSCWQCSKRFSVKPSQVKKKGGHFCSRSCRALYYVGQIASSSKQETAFLDALERGGARFARQRRIGPYIVDAVDWDRRIIVEFDGVYWHSLKSASYDMERDAFLNGHGYKVIRVTDVAWKADKASAIASTLRQLGVGQDNAIVQRKLWED